MPSDQTTDWRPIGTLIPEGLQHYILWNGKRRFVGWLIGDGWCDATVDDHASEAETPQPTHWHPWPETPDA